MMKKLSLNFKKLKLARKLTILLLIVFFGGIILSGIVLANALNLKAQNEITSGAEQLMATMNSVRLYTSTQVSPYLNNFLKEDEFLPQVVPAFSARKVFENLQKQKNIYQDYRYKEAMLNPTNIDDKADTLETSIIKRFKENPNRKEQSGFRTINGENFFYTTSPLFLHDPSCLRCHSRPEVAPKAMIKMYGEKNGFNWRLHDINGIQIVSVPIGSIFQKARQSFFIVMLIITFVFALAIYLANFWLRKYVVKPIKQVVKVAEAVSTGDMEAEFEKYSNDEIGNLVEAFTRMKLSLAMAIRRFEQYRLDNRNG
jgi:methyl-accepting chemotaxis protein